METNRNMHDRATRDMDVVGLEVHFDDNSQQAIAQLHVQECELQARDGKKVRKVWRWGARPPTAAPIPLRAAEVCCGSLAGCTKGADALEVPTVFLWDECPVTVQEATATGIQGGVVEEVDL